ncbi:MAG: rod shape-determining protein MreC [Alphaproteobacteria bacterium]|nr:rod shape-determining protein MreC [Alphaproteobacteria bacterium]
MKRRRSLFLHLSQIRLLAKKFALVILFLTAFALMLVNKTDTVVMDKTSGVATGVLSPLIDLLVVPARMIAKGYDYFSDLRQIHKDNIKLREENRRLNTIYDKFRSLEVENKLMADLLNYVTPPESTFVTARVIAEEGDAFSHSMIAYTGDENVKKGQVALADKGVVGRVDKVANNYVKVILVTDINSKIPVMVEDTRVRGILSGDNSTMPKLVFIPLDAKINIGDRIVTSGVAGVFPAGLPIGKVVSVSKTEIAVKPFSSLEQLEYIKLVNYGLEGVLSDGDNVSSGETR